MPRRDLGALLGNVEDAPTPAPYKAPTATPAVAPESVASAPKEAVEREARPTSKPKAKAVLEESAGPTYLRFVRKETRLREDQQNALTVQARRLNRASPVGSVRITENSLIRIAVDLLLARIESAEGASEAELLESLKS